MILHKMTEFHLIQMFPVINFSDSNLFQSQLSKPLLMKVKKKQNQIVRVHTRCDVRTSTKIESNYLEAIILGCSYGQDTHINIGWLIVSKKIDRKKERKIRKKERKEERNH